MQLWSKINLSAIFIISLFTSCLTATEENHTLAHFNEGLQQIHYASDYNERLNNLFKLYWEWRMNENPEEATFIGYPGHDSQWTDYSEEAIQQRSYFSKKFLEILTEIPKLDLSEEDQISYAILKRTLEDELALIDFNGSYLILNQMYGIHLSSSMIMELMANKNLEDYQCILNRLQALPILFDQVIQLLEKGIEAGITPPRLAIRQVPEQIRNQMTDKPLDSPFLKAFTQFPDSIDLPLRNELSRKAQDIYQHLVFPALNKLYVYTTERYLPHCRDSIAFSDLPRGNEWYLQMVRSSTTTELSPQAIHKIGLKEIERIHQEMVEVQNQAGFEGSYEEFLHFLKTDPQFFYSNRDDLLKNYQILSRTIESRLPLIFSKLPKLPFEVVPIPSYSEESQIAAYYCPGSISQKRPGYFFINTSYPEKRLKWEMEPLSLHEAVPGHHLQLSLVLELDHLPEFRKQANFTAYIEGWGLYAESLGIELGFYQDPYSKFGRLSYEMLRAIRLVVDTGMHAMGWSRDQAIDFFKQNVSMNDHEIITEVDRYLVMPAQALAYKIGELKIQEMRNMAKRALGSRYDIKDFHEVWLQHGTVPLDIAEQKIHAWINQILLSQKPNFEQR